MLKELKIPGVVSSLCPVIPISTTVSVLAMSLTRNESSGGVTPFQVFPQNRKEKKWQDSLCVQLDFAQRSKTVWLCFVTESNREPQAIQCLLLSHSMHIVLSILEYGSQPLRRSLRGIRTFRNSEASVYLNVSAFVFVDLLKIPPVYLMSVYFLLCCPLKNWNPPWETVSVSVYSFGSCVLIQISLRVSVSSLELWGDVTSPAALNRCSEDSDSQSTLSETSRRDSAESGEDKE